MDLIEQLRAARRVNTPLVLAITSDQPALQAKIAEVLNGKAVTFAWDAVRGLRPVNEGAVAWCEEFLGVQNAKPADKESALKTLAANTGSPVACLDFAQNLPQRAALLMLNIGKWVADPVVATGILNLRETFKRNKRTWIGTDAGCTLPSDLQSSVVVIEESLPTAEERGKILDGLYAGAKDAFPALSSDTRGQAVAAGSGLSPFMVEQTFAMSLVPESGLDLAGVWERKRTAFNQTDGVTLEEPNGPTFEDIRGLAQILKREEAHFAGKNPSAVVVRIEEIEKAFAGVGGDTSGTAQATLGYILDFMEENRCTGFIAVGPGGSGKSLVSKALARQFNRPSVVLDVKATEDKFVGEGPRKVRAALRALKGLADEKPLLFVATCNKLDSLPPELRRRFRQGIWFFDLPTAEEREAIWTLYLAKHNLPHGDKAVKVFVKRYSNWTGAEIRNAVEMAADEGISIAQAAEFIVPVADADPEALRRLRSMAHERFLSASYPGPYLNPDAPKATVEGDGGRTLDLSE